MPRPQRCRRICILPEFWSFAPEEGGTGEKVFLSIDELETVRLLDKELMTQENCALKMNVARTTVTAMYESARRKIADAIISGKRLIISGGSWQLEGHKVPESLSVKGEKIMRVAVTYEKGEIFQHFGHSEQFKIYDVEDKKIIKSEIVGTEGQGHGALAGFLKCAKADVLICGGIGGGAKAALAEAGIKLYGGAQGNADDAVKSFIEGKLQYNPDVKCDHHDHEEGHSCGDHDHSCGGHEHHSCKKPGTSSGEGLPTVNL